MHVVRVFDGETLPKPDPARVAIITGSWAMVTDRLPWSETTAQWIRDAMAVEMPMFGVCYGHQLMAHALGGRVGDHPAGREIGCHPIRLLDAAHADPLLMPMPDRFPAHLTHAQSVIELPVGATVLAASDHDPHQIVRYGREAISAQFHPEYTEEICAAVVRFHADAAHEEARDLDRMLARITTTPDATALLSRFIKRALNRRTAQTRVGDNRLQIVQ
jgi:GMP synthase (glutamine-hydrolysing)